MNSDVAPDTELRSVDYSAYIDGLRALAVLAVLVDHTVGHSPPLVGTIWRRVGFTGAHGVELFFVISGLCLARSYLHRYHRSNSLGFDGPAFFAKRIVRILPPYYAAVALLAIGSLFPLWRQTQASPAGGSMADHLSFAQLAVHLIFAAREHHALNASFWSLRVEAIWYLLFPLTLFVYVRNSAALAVVAIISAAVAFAGGESDSSGLHTIFEMANAMPAFILGIVAADPRSDRFLRLDVLWVLLIAGILGGLAADHYYMNGYRIIWAVVAFAFVVLARRVTWLRGALSVRGLTSIGLVSYSIYLIHEPVVAMLQHVGVPLVPAMAGGLATGYAFWWAVERPITSDSIRKPLVDAIMLALRKISFVARRSERAA